MIDNAIQLQGAPFPAGTYPAVAAAVTAVTAMTAVPEPVSLSILGATAAASVLGQRSRRSPSAARLPRH